MSGEAFDHRETEVYQVLEKLGIAYERYAHEPVYTIEQAEEALREELRALNVNNLKNLFLRDNKGKQHYLVILTAEKTAELKALARKINSTQLSFASDRRLNKYLNLDKGAVSPFGLINDRNNHVKVIVDQDIKDEKNIILHPNVNTASIVITPADLEKFLAWSGNAYTYESI